MTKKIGNSFQEVTLKITLADTPVSRVLLVPDSISLIELYALITFLFEWDRMSNHAFRFSTRRQLGGNDLKDHVSAASSFIRREDGVRLRLPHRQLLGTHH